MPINYDAQIEIRDARNGSWFWIHTHVWRDPDLSQSSKVVYGTIASYANVEQTAFPSITRIAADSGISERHVYRCLKELEQHHYLKVERQNGQPNLYTLTKTTPDMMSPLTGSHPTPDKKTVLTISNITRTKEQEEQQPGAELAHEREATPIAGKVPNPLSLTRSQVLAFLKEFPGLTSSEMKAQVEKCNSYMAMSSEPIKNPGLFFRGWLKRFREEQRVKEHKRVRFEEATRIPEVSDEESRAGLERLRKMKEAILGNKL